MEKLSQESGVRSQESGVKTCCGRSFMNTYGTLTNYIKVERSQFLIGWIVERNPTISIFKGRCSL
ncbi:hypothetical protein IQ226_02085 [Dolichospermum sp. LEGE 00240]|nr:hypothetical protein [Dolichospermum sp. LEGE 00240]MDM3844543.1 hypothetical protein [Aphanizomenon gracile PMC638.10]MDM3852524.1 hypothetical protein [Aphanizomenon gracile PMC627.10]MDM3855961.1 hypothetical protein [Aphanizomenon gracile PMC649.10]